jgi:hypothetical protein
MQVFFPRIDLAAHRQQVAQVAAHLKEHPPPCPQPKLAVGRPKRVRSSEEVLRAEAAANALRLDPEEHGIAQAHIVKRGKYTRWFNSPYINDIIAAFTRSGGSARAAVAALQKDAPDNRFDHRVELPVAVIISVTRSNLRSALPVSTLSPTGKLVMCCKACTNCRVTEWVWEMLLQRSLGPGVEFTHLQLLLSLLRALPSRSHIQIARFPALA